MAVVSFWGNNIKETGQTLSVVAIGTAMALEHNYKTLVISTSFRDKTMEDCFWEKNRSETVKSITGGGNSGAGLSNGFEGLIKIIQSNRTSSNIIKDYAKAVFRDNRLDVLLSPTTENPDEFYAMTKYYKNIIQLADKEYDLVLVDIDKRMSAEDKSEILKISNAIMITLKQSSENIEMAKDLRARNRKSKSNMLFLVGKYDSDSKYNTKNITRYIKEPKEVSAIPYSKTFDEASEEGKVADYFIKYRSFSDTTDRNVKFIEEAKRTCDNIIFKLQELQMRM